MIKQIDIAGKTIGENAPVFIIAEAGVNHNGNINIAKKLIDVAVEAGVDAVKFQTFSAKEVMIKTAPKASYQKETTNPCESQYEMAKRLELKKEDFLELSEHCKKNNVLFLSTPHDEESIDLLDKIGVKAFKIGSGDITNIPYLKKISKIGKPIILSTGMSNICEVEEAVNTIYSQGNTDLILLHCVSNYPAKVKDCNLRAMKTLSNVFNLPVGFSDHTLGIEISIAAVAMGAKVIEKHFTLDKTMIGPDHRSSLESEGLKAMIEGIRKVEQSLGNGIKKPRNSEIDIMKVARKSIVAKTIIKKGEKIKENHLSIKRPGTGIKPKNYDSLIGKVAKKNIEKDSLILWRDIE